MADYHIPVVPDHEYHLSNRAVGREEIFVEERNYDFFLGRASIHVSPVAEFLSYTLLPNHFHFIVRIKALEAIEKYYSEVKNGKSVEQDLVCDFIMERFSNFLNSYTKAFNKTYQRQGALFIDYLKRQEIHDRLQMLETAVYIHQDAVRHGHCKMMKDWNWTSFNYDYFQQKEELVRLFGGLEQYELMHRRPMDKCKIQILEVD
jgi:putative transposase